MYERHDPDGNWSVETTEDAQVTVEVKRITMTGEEAVELSQALADAAEKNLALAAEALAGGAS